MNAQLMLGVSSAAIAVMASWAWRSSATPLWARLALPIFAVGSACCVPILNAKLDDAMQQTSFASLPNCFTIIGLAAHDREGMVDLWLEGAGRIRTLPLDDDTKDSLREVQTALRTEPRVRVCKQKASGSGDGDEQGDGLPGKDKGKSHESDGARSKLKIDESLFLKSMKETQQ